MVDYVKLSILSYYMDVILGTDCWIEIEESKRTKHDGKKPKVTKAVKLTYEPKAKGSPLRLVHYPDTGFTQLRGSLHAHAQGGNNYLDYSAEDLYRTLDDLVRMGIPLDESRLHNVECGVNVPFDGKTFTNALLYQTGGKQYKHVRVNDPYGRYVVAEFDDYELKAYDKAAQNKLEYGLSRFELKVRAMKKVTDAPMYLEDLGKLCTLEHLSTMMLESFDEAMYYDHTIRVKELTKGQRTKLRDYRNRDWWMSVNKKTRSRHKEKYLDIIAAHSDNQKGQVRSMMSNKVETML